MDRKHMRIAAVFATMNRSATACAAVRALAAQSHPPAVVVVADNASSDPTAEDLRGMRNLPFPLVVEQLPENLGNAGGIARAIEIAFDRGAGAVWILDDDSLPRPDSLEHLVGAQVPELAIPTPLQLDPATGGLTWPLLVKPAAGRSGTDDWVMEDDPRAIAAMDGVFEVRAAWTGILLDHAAWKATGPVDASWFIRGEDEDYAARLSRTGRRFLLVRDAVLDHPGPKRMIRWKLGSRTFIHEPGLADWKMHYMIRNRVCRSRRHGRGLTALGVAALHGPAVARYDGIRKLPVWFMACREGWAGRLGKWKHHP